MIERQPYTHMLQGLQFDLNATEVVRVPKRNKQGTAGVTTTSPVEETQNIKITNNAKCKRTARGLFHKEVCEQL